MPGTLNNLTPQPKWWHHHVRYSLDCDAAPADVPFVFVPRWDECWSIGGKYFGGFWTGYAVNKKNRIWINNIARKFWEYWLGDNVVLSYHLRLTEVLYKQTGTDNFKINHWFLNINSGRQLQEISIPPGIYMAYYAHCNISVIFRGMTWQQINLSPKVIMLR